MDLETVWHGATWRESWAPLDPPPPEERSAYKTQAEKEALILAAIGNEMVLRRTIYERSGLTVDQVKRTLKVLIKAKQITQIGKVHSGRVMYRRVT